jgi:hypothetical protein
MLYSVAKWSTVMDLSIKGVPQEQVARLRGASLRAPGLLEFEVANTCLK